MDFVRKMNQDHQLDEEQMKWLNEKRHRHYESIQ